MSFKKVLFIFIVAFLCQLSLVNIFAVKNTGPNLILCVMIMITFLYEDGFRSIPFAIFFGLLLDICSGLYVGVTPLLMLGAGIFTEVARIWLNTEKIYTLLTTVLIITIMYHVLYFAAMKILGNPAGAVFALKGLPLFVIYNCAVCAIMFVMMHKKAEKYHNDRYNI